MKTVARKILSAAALVLALASAPAARAELDAAALEKFLDGKDVVELNFSGVQAKAREVRDDVKVDSAWQNNFVWTATDTPGGVKVHVVLKLSQENQARAKELLTLLAQKKIFWEERESVVLSLAGNDEARDIARRMIAGVMADAEKKVGAIAPDAKWVMRKPPRHGWLAMAETEGGKVSAQVGIVDVTVERSWNLSENATLKHERIMLPHLGLVIRLVYTPENREAQAALSEAIKPLVKLEADLEKK